MKLFRVPYRWLPRTAWTNVRWIFGGIWGGICNVVRWTPVIWFDRDYDWLDLASVMEYKLRRSAVYFEKYGHHVGSDLDARRMRVCAQILKRLQDDDYFENAQKRFGDTRQAADFASKQSKNDKLYLGMLIGKYLNHWWD